MGGGEIDGFDENGQPIYKKKHSGGTTVTVTTDQGPEHIFALKHGINQFAARKLLGMDIGLPEDLRDGLFECITPELEQAAAAFKDMPGARDAIKSRDAFNRKSPAELGSIESAGAEIEDANRDGMEMQGNSLTHAEWSTRVFDAERPSNDPRSMAPKPSNQAAKSNVDTAPSVRRSSQR